MSSLLNPQQKERIRYHLGYMQTESAASIQLGIPRPAQTIFLLEEAFNLVKDPLVVTRIDKLLTVLDEVECKLLHAASSVQGDTLGDLKLHPLKQQGKLGTDSLEAEHTRWAQRLANTLGVPLYPFAQRFRQGGPGSNLRVVS